MSNDEFAQVDFKRPEIVRSLARAYAVLLNGAPPKKPSDIKKSKPAVPETANPGSTSRSEERYYQERMF